MNKVLAIFLLLVLAVAMPIQGHFDHGVGGERIQFAPIPSIPKPPRPSDKVLGFPKPPSIQMVNQDYDFSRGLTVSTWIRVEDSASANPVVTQLEWAPGSGSFALFASGDPGYGFQLRWSDGSFVELSGYSVPKNRWVHYAATFDGENARVFVDGAAVVTGEFKGLVIAKSPDPVLVGANDITSGVPFLGLISDVQIWEKGLTEIEVLSIRDGGNRMTPSSNLNFESALEQNLAISGDVTFVADPSGERELVARFDYLPSLAIAPELPNKIETEITISAWVYNRGVRRLGGPVVGNWGSDPGDRSFVLWSFGGDGFGFRAFWSDGTQNNLTVVDTPAEEWFHYAATYDGREMRLYVNGIPAGRTIAVDKTFARSDSGCWVGGVGSPGIGSFQGFLDEVGIWSRALSESDVQLVLQKGASPDPGLVYWSNFDGIDNPNHEVTRVSADLAPPDVYESASAGWVEMLRTGLAKHTGIGETLHQAFWWAAAHDRLNAAEVLLEKGADINALLGLGGHTALHAAVRERRFETVQFLVDHGADTNLADRTYEGSAWEWADRFGHAVLRSYLLDTAAQSNLYAAVEHDTPEYVVPILSEDATEWDLEQALRLGAQLGRAEVIELLIARGADPQSKDEKGSTAHDLAVRNNQYECVDILRARVGADIAGDRSYLERINALDKAIGNHDVRLAASLIDIDPDLVLSDPEGERTWLQYAADVRDVEIARMLIEKGASVIKTRNGHTALSWAVTVGAGPVGKEIVKGGAELDSFTAAGLGDLLKVQSYFDGDSLRKGVSLTGSKRFDKDRNELSKPPTLAADQVSDALYIAARNGHLAVVRFLLAKSGDPNFRAARGGTPLYWAVNEGHVVIVQALLEAGGDAGVPDRYGRNATRIASRSENQELKRMLGID
jgi:ankyrin repeat protein